MNGLEPASRILRPTNGDTPSQTFRTLVMVVTSAGAAIGIGIYWANGLDDRIDQIATRFAVRIDEVQKLEQLARADLRLDLTHMLQESFDRRREVADAIRTDFTDRMLTSQQRLTAVEQRLHELADRQNEIDKVLVSLSELVRRLDRLEDELGSGPR